jgi:hypothetical protein
MEVTLVKMAEPPTLIGNSKLATMAMCGHDLAPIWNTLVKRVNVNPQDASALLDLATIAHIQGRPGDRVSLRTRAFELTRIFQLPAAHQTTDAVKVLAFMSCGDYLANMPIEFLLNGSDINLDLVFVAPGQPPPQFLPEHDVAFVAVADQST